MQQFKKGDPCRVKILATGEVVDAVYSHTGTSDKSHWVYSKSIDGTMSKPHYAITKGKIHKYDGFSSYYYCRFVGNPCVLEWVV